MTMYHVTNDKIFSVTGEKAATLLHGQISNSINDLAVGAANYNLLLTQKGKVVADLYVYRTELGFFCIVPQNFYDIVKNQIAKLAPLSRCVISDTDRVVVHVLGTVGWSDANVMFVKNERLGEVGVDLLVDSVDLASVTATLQKRGLKPITAAEVEFKRIKNGVPIVGKDVTQKNLPQEALLDRALHFNKGCYLGQEVIARLHFRGHVNKVLARFVVEGTGFKTGDAIAYHGAACGNVTSVAFDAQENKTYILGYIAYSLMNEKEFFIEKKLATHV